MKTRIIAIILIVSFAGNIFADTLTGIFFPGIKTDYSVPGEPASKNTASVAMEQQLKDAYTLFGNYQQQVVIGQSQGGFRALGYANYLKEKGEADKLKAVISIGAPARGFTPLIKGKGDLTERIKTQFDIISKGISSLIFFPYISLAGPLSLDFILENIYGGKDTKNFISHMISGDNGMVSDTVLADFHPDSNYIKNRIKPDIIQAQGHWERVVDRTISIPTIRITGWFKISIVWVTIPIYKTIWVIDKPEQRIPKMPANLKVGFIVGNQKDPLELVDSMGFGKKEDIQKSFSLFAEAMRLSAGINIALADLMFALGIASICKFDFINAAAYFVVEHGYKINYNNALSAHDLIENFPSRYNRDILLTDSSDGFIPYAAQKWDPVTELGCQSISNQGSYVVYDVNHYTELEDDRIWGTGGDKDNPKENGKVYEWTTKATQGQWFDSNYLKMKN